MRVLHTESSVNWGGQEYRILEQMHWLGAHGHETALAARPDSAILERARAEGLTAHAVPFRGHYNPGAITAARRLVRSGGFHIVDCHGSRDAVTLAFARGVAPVVRSRHVSQPLKGKLHRRLQWRWGCDHALATALVIRDAIVLAGLKTAAEVSVVGEWASEAFFDVARREQHRAEVRREFAVPAGRPVVAVVGMLRGDKAQHLLIEAAALLRTRGRPVFCLIVGAPIRTQADYEAELRARVRAAGLEDAVAFAGYRDDVARLTQAADALAVTSIAVEGQSRAVPQAFASLTPVVASRIGGIPELVTAGETGWLVEPGDAGGLARALEEALADGAAARAMAARARRFAEAHLTMAAKMAETVAVYEKTRRIFEAKHSL